MALHELKEFEDDLGLALLLGVVNALQGITQNTGSDHLIELGCIER